MINAVLYAGFSKRINSTMVPTASNTEASITLSCAIFEPCTMEAPVLIIQPGVNLARYNYAYIPDFQRYYWITGREFREGRFHVSMMVDALASFKNGIGASSQYVIRSASNYDGTITDTLYIKTGQHAQRSALPNSIVKFPTAIGNGIFMIGINGKKAADTISFGSVNYYAFTLAQLAAFLEALMSTEYLGELDDLSASTVKTILNPMQYIASCQWLPIETSFLDAVTTATIPFGWWDITGISHYTPPANSTTFYKPITYNLRNIRHPQATRGAYLNRAPYATYKVFIPCAGFVELPDRYISTDTELTIDYVIDFPTGDATIKIRSHSGEGSELHMVAMTSAQMGVDVPLAQVFRNVKQGISTVGTIAGAIANIATGNIGGAIASVTSGISSAADAAAPVPSFISSTSSTGQYFSNELSVYGEFDYIAAEDMARFGRPCCKQLTISTLRGYVLCSNATVDIAGASRDEMDTIKGYMEGGFFYE